jgi:protease I
MRLGRQRLKNKRVAILAGDGFEYVELVVPMKALEAAGATCEVVSLHEGRIRGMNISEPTKAVKVDCTLENADPSRYDALLIPGGFIGPDFVRQSARARAFVRAFDEANKPIATLCHGPWLLVSAELVSGRVLASWPGIRDDIVHAGGTWRDEPVVHDRNWVSSRGPQDLPAFVRATTELFAGPEHERVEESAPELPDVPARIELPPREKISSPKYDRPDRVALMATHRLPGPAVWVMLGVVATVGLGVIALRRSLGARSP